MTGFDWYALMRSGIGGLGLAPDQFWRLTPAELQLMLGRWGVSAPLTRGRLDALEKAFPDKNKDTTDD